MDGASVGNVAFYSIDRGFLQARRDCLQKLCKVGNSA